MHKKEKSKLLITGIIVIIIGIMIGIIPIFLQRKVGMKESSLPTDNNGNVVLEAHNGTADISYFNQLHQLEIGDKASIYYKGTKYTYIIENIYDVEKDGYVEVNRDINKNTLTLITCKKDTEDRQLVIILYLLSKEKY